MLRVNFQTCLFFGLFFSSKKENFAFADVFHYNNILPGDRSANLGGAYTGIADDSSAVIFNPGGLGFTQSGSLSASVNTFSSKVTTFKKVIGKSDYSEASSDLVPAFVGGLKKFKDGYSGWIIAGGIWASDYENQDQDDLVRNESAPYNSLSNTIGHFHRVVNASSKVLNIGVAAGKTISPIFGLGIGLYLQKTDVLTQEYQDSGIVISPNFFSLTNEAKQYGTLYSSQTSSFRQKQNLIAIGPGIGFQIMPWDKLSIGFSARKLFFLKETISSNADTGFLFHFKNGKVLDLKDVLPDSPNKERITGSISRSTPTKEYSTNNRSTLNKSENLFENSPLEVRTGFALFANEALLISGDISYHNALDVAQPEQKANAKNSVLNFALGTEYYLSDSWPIRFGAFTNKDARPEIEPNKTGQRDHVDLYGATLGVCWAQPLSQLSLSVMHQRGTGKAQKISGDKTIHVVKVEQWNFQLSSTYSLN